MNSENQTNQTQPSLLPATEVALSAFNVEQAQKKVMLALYYLRDAQAAIDGLFEGWPQEEAQRVVSHRHTVEARLGVLHSINHTRAIQSWLKTLKPLI